MSDEFIEDVARRAGPFEVEVVETAAGEVLAAVASHLSAIPAALSAALGEGWVARMNAGRERDPADFDETVAAVAAATSVTPNQALELTDSVLAETAGRLSEAGRRELTGGLPAAWADRVVAPSPPAARAAPPAETHAGEGRTLATARPGSQHPVADARPAGAQAHSIAANPDPHADTKLGSTHGVQKDDTLAKGKPGSDHAVADSD
jgi:hypothetical protein